MNQVDKAGTTYWNTNWSRVDFPKVLDIKDTSLDNYYNLEVHKYFQKIIGNKRGLKILEIGCANSVWPIYFHQYFDAEVYGLDYSETGCEKSRFLLKEYNVAGKIYCMDLFSPSSDLLGQFDLVVSFGVVEHFENTSDCLKKCSMFVKPGGFLFTLIPNMTGIIGLIQKYVDRNIYNLHVPITKKQFHDAHNKANLILENCDYLMSVSLGVVNSGSFSSNPLNRLLRHGLSATSKFIWLLERHGLKIPKNGFTSPYIIALAKTIC